jgi:N-acetylglucosamine malate deacetylase 1
VLSTIMAVAAHPGDALFTMGAAVAQHIHDGGAGVFVSLTLGEKGNPADISSAKYGEMQRDATEKAATMLRAKAELLSYPDAELLWDREVSMNVCDLIRKHKPAVVITHWSGSWHKDHQNCHGIVRDAIFFAALPGISRERPAHRVGKLFYAENWEDDSGFQADTYLDITPVYKNWLKACDVYPMWRGQTGFFRYHDYYQSLAVMRGCLSRFQYAVALMRDPNERLSKVRSLE